MVLVHPDPQALPPDLAALDAPGGPGGFFVLRTGGVPSGPPSTLAHVYAAPRAGFGPAPGRPADPRVPDGDPLAFRVRKVAAALRAPEPRIAVSVTHQALAARLWSVALGAAALYGRLPDLGPGSLHWDPDGSAPDDLWLPEVRALPEGTGLDVVRDEHLAPLTAALRARYRISARLLWGNAGSALAGAVRQLDRWARAAGRPDVAGRARALAAPLFAGPGLAGTLDPVTLRRRSCCLYYRLPGGGLCGDCCLDRPPRAVRGDGRG
ncbi:(2Fe-2S)-binding protein [Streptomyces sp. NPDC008313]|uniref:(2Fe-2S)-binding protein n=1 Tax=Streptomyces sp. NPDC008313 TaxID=3364826 RepID=UPI0036E5BCCB